MIDWLRYHKLTDRDKSGQILEVFNEGRGETAGAETDVRVFHTQVPDDKILIIDNWCVQLLADNSEPYNVVFGVSYQPAATVYFTGLNALFNNFQGQAQVWASADRPMVILPGEKPEAIAYFLLAGAHSIVSRIRGWLIPRGSMTRGFGGL